MSKEKMSRDAFRIWKISPKVEADEEAKLDKMLMGYGSITAFIAPTNSGKSNLIVNLLNRRCFYRKKFDHVFVMSPTMEVDAVWSAAKGVDHVWDHYDDEAVRELYEAQLARIKKDRRGETPNILLIVDDCIAEIPKQHSAINSLSTKLRHSNITLWLTSQKFTRIPVMLRNQVRYWVLFRAACKNKLEKDAIVSEVGASVAEETFEALWKACGDNPWNFMVVSVRSPVNKMFRREFQSYLVPAEENPTPE
jgi:Poxvirus A32 protein